MVETYNEEAYNKDTIFLKEVDENLQKSIEDINNYIKELQDKIKELQSSPSQNKEIEELKKKITECNSKDKEIKILNTQMNNLKGQIDLCKTHKNIVEKKLPEDIIQELTSISKDLLESNNPDYSFKIDNVVEKLSSVQNGGKMTKNKYMNNIVKNGKTKRRKTKKNKKSKTNRKTGVRRK